MDKDLQALLKICSAFGIYLQTPKCSGHIYIFLLMGILLFNCIFGVANNKLENELIISWTVSTSVFISQLLTHFTIMCEAVTKHQQHTDFLRLLQDIDVYFKILLKMEVKKSTILKEIRCNLIVSIIVSKICLLVFALLFLICYDAGYFWWALLAILAARFRFLQVIAYLEMLKYYVLALNKKLNQVVCLKTEKSKQLLDIDYKRLQSIEVIRNIKHTYAALYEAAALMNDFCQASLFAVSASYFLDFTCHLYWTLLALENLLCFYNIISSLVTILPLGFFIVKFCYICQIIKDEGQRTAVLLLRLVGCDNCPLIKKNYKNLVHDFCMQLMHQRIEFTAYRFFTFDFKCMFAICALIATHLIILIQFTKSGSSS